MSDNAARDRRTAQAISNAITKLQREHYGRFVLERSGGEQAPEGVA